MTDQEDTDQDEAGQAPQDAEPETADDAGQELGQAGKAEIMSGADAGQGSGSIVERPPARIVQGRHGGTLTPFTPETSKIAQERRRELRRLGAMDAVYQVTHAKGTRQAVRALTVPLVETLLAGGKGIAPIHQQLMRVTNLAEDRQQANVQSQAGSVNLSMSGDAAQQFMNAMLTMSKPKE